MSNSIVARIKSSFPKGVESAPQGQDTLPLPTTFSHDVERKRLVIEVDLSVLEANPDAYVNVMYESELKDGKKVKTNKVKGFNVLAGLSRADDFATVITVGDSETGLKISKPFGRPSNLSFTVCDTAQAERIQRMQEAASAAAAGQ